MSLVVVVTMWKLGAGAYSSMVEVVRWVGDRRGVVIVVMMEVGKGGGGDGFGGCECCEFPGRQDLYGMSSNGEKGAMNGANPSWMFAIAVVWGFDTSKSD